MLFRSPAGGKIEFRYAFYINPAWRVNDASKKQEEFLAVSEGNTITAGYGSVSATNICGNIWSFSTSTEVFSATVTYYHIFPHKVNKNT